MFFLLIYYTYRILVKEFTAGKHVLTIKYNIVRLSYNSFIDAKTTNRVNNSVFYSVQHIKHKLQAVNPYTVI